MILFQSIQKNSNQDMSSVQSFENIRSSGSPYLLYMYSDYWVGCLTLNPIVNRLESELRNEYKLYRVDVHSVVGNHISDLISTKMIPTFVFFDENGKDIFIKHSVPTKEEVYEKFRE